MPVQCRCNTRPQFTRQRLNFSWVDSLLHADCSVAQELEFIIQLNRNTLNFQHSVEECQCSQIHTTQRLGSSWLQFQTPHSQPQHFKLTVSIVTCGIMPVQCRCDTKPLFRFQRLNFKFLLHLDRIPHRSPQFTPPQLQLASGPCKQFCRLQCQCPQITSHTDASSAGLPFFLPSAPDSSHSTSLPS